MSNAAEAAAPPAAPRVSLVREYGPTLAALLWLYAATGIGAGFLMSMFVVLVLPVWLGRMAWLAWRRPARRRAQVPKLVLLLLATGAVAVIQRHNEEAVKAHAQTAVAAVTAYRDQHGTYPDSLDQAGLDAATLRHQWKIFYSNQDGRVGLFYASTTMPLDIWNWDFDKRAWEFRPD